LELLTRLCTKKKEIVREIIIPQLFSSLNPIDPNKSQNLFNALCHLIPPSSDDNSSAYNNFLTLLVLELDKFPKGMFHFIFSSFLDISFVFYL